MRGKRLDIQGLRALAVGIVVLFHLWPKHLPGGYVGVDVFFVISGFLITSHLASELERTGSIGLTKFWARRIRRLLPAAFTVLAASLITAFVFLPKSLLQQTLYEIGASALYVQNWVLAGSSVDYLGADNKPTLAQHFWSLSVEEQFYLAWPIIILLAVWVASKIRRTDETNQRAMRIALAAIFAISLAYSIYETARSQPSAYFVTPTRAWEFAGGGLLAFLPAWPESASKPRLDRALRLVAGWGGLALIVFAALEFNAATQFPGYVALIPVLGSMLLIYTGQREAQWTPGWLAKFRPIQLVGDISYAIYLWHWPLIILFPFVLNAELKIAGKVGILVVTLALAIATKYLIEDPARASTRWLRIGAPSYRFAAAGMAIIVAVSVGAIWIDNRESRALADSIAAAAIEDAACFGAAAMVPANNCEEPFAVTDTVNPAFSTEDVYWSDGVLAAQTCKKPEGSLLRRCEFGNTTDPSLTVALVGDSHAEHIIDPMAIAAKSRGWRLIPFARPRCSGLETEIQIDAIKKAAPELAEDASDCLKFNHELMTELTTRTDIDVVVYSNYNTSIPAQQAADTWAQVRASGKVVIAMSALPGQRNIPGVPSGPECVETHSDQYDPCNWKRADEIDYMREAATLAVVPIMDLSDYICTDKTCHTVIGGTIVFFDRHHLSYTFAATLAPFIGDRIAAILAG